MTRNLIDRTPPRLRPGAVLMFRTVDDSLNDRVPGLAAEIAFFLLLSLVPLLLAILGTIGFIAQAFHADFSAQIVTRMTELAGNVLSQSTVEETIRPLVTQVVQEGRGDIATFGFILTFFSASRALRVVATAISIAYDLEETRPGWQQRVVGLGLTLGGILLGLLIVPLLVLGPGFGGVIEDTLNVTGIAATWSIFYWPTGLIIATALVVTLYHLVAPWWTPWRRDLPGALLAVTLFLAGTVGLRFYTTSSFGADSAYGQFAAPLVILLWFWVSAMCLLIGAELNAEIEGLWPTTQERREHEESDHTPDTTGPSEEPRPDRDNLEQDDHTGPQPKVQ